MCCQTKDVTLLVALLRFISLII